MFRRFLSYYKPQMGLFVADTVCALVLAAIDLAFPIILRNLTGGLFTQGQAAIMQALGMIAVGLVLMYAIRCACRYFVSYWGHVMGARMESKMREDLFDQYERFSFAYFDRNSSGDMMSRVVNDVDQVGDGLLQGFTQLFTGVITIVGTLAFMLSINLAMTLVVVLVTPLSIFAAGAIAKLSNKSFTAQQRIQGQLGGHIEEYVGEQKLVDAFAYGPNTQARFAALNAELYTAGERAQFMGSLSNPGKRS